MCKYSCHEHSLHVTAHAPCIEQLLRTSIPAVLGCPGGGVGCGPGDDSGGGGGTVTAVSGSETRDYSKCTNIHDF